MRHLILVSQSGSIANPHVYQWCYMYEVNFDLKFHFSTLIQSDFVKTTVNVGA